jgi:hypothetical protein
MVGWRLFCLGLDLVEENGERGNWVWWIEFEMGGLAGW